MHLLDEEMIMPFYLDTQLFDTGNIVCTIGVQTLFKDNVFAMSYAMKGLIDRHTSGDWGDLCEEDVQVNEDALKYKNRLFSVYTTTIFNVETKVWIITEADRSLTTILLPNEY